LRLQNCRSAQLSVVYHVPQNLSQYMLAPPSEFTVMGFGDWSGQTGPPHQGLLGWSGRERAWMAFGQWVQDIRSLQPHMGEDETWWPSLDARSRLRYGREEESDPTKIMHCKTSVGAHSTPHYNVEPRRQRLENILMLLMRSRGTRALKSVVQANTTA
jgi:hypothetical protein